MEHAYAQFCCSNCGDVIDVPLYCGDRFCPVCSVARKSRIKARLSWLILNAPRNPANRFFHLTLTISSESDLPAMIKRISTSFRKLRQRAYWKPHVDGGAFVVEVTGHPGAWHAHIHAVMYSRWMRWDQLQKMWKAVSKGIGVYITHIPESAAVNYLSKYLAKPDAPEIVALEIAEGLKGVRMFSVFGSWHKVNLTYSKPVRPCPKCGGSHWANYDILKGNFPRPHYKDFPVFALPRPPETAPMACH